MEKIATETLDELVGSLIIQNVCLLAGLQQRSSNLYGVCIVHAIYWREPHTAPLHWQSLLGVRADMHSVT